MRQMTFPKFLAQLDALPDSLKITQKHVAAIIMLFKQHPSHKPRRLRVARSREVQFSAHGQSINAAAPRFKKSGDGGRNQLV